MKIDIARRDHSAPTGIFSSKRVAIYDADVVIAADEHEVARLDSWARQVGMMDEILFSEPIEDLGAERDYKIKEVLK